MKLIITSLQALKNRITHSYQPTMLGRWARESCDIKTYRRVDLTNEDHCGVCNYQLDNTVTIPSKTYMIINDDIVLV